MGTRDRALDDDRHECCTLCHHTASLDTQHRLQAKHQDRRIASVMHAAMHGRLEHVRHWIEHMRHDIDAIDSRGMTLLHHVVVKGHVTVVAYLLQQGAALQTRVVDSKDTVLHLAAANGHVDVVQCLLAAGAHVEARNIESETPLLAAIRIDHVRVVQTLLAHGASPTAPWLSEDLDVGTGLHLAVQCGHVRLVTFLLGVVGLDANQRTQRRRATPLHMAARHGHLTLVQLLVQRHHADVHARDAQAMTPLHYACDFAKSSDAIVQQHVAIVQLLLAVGAKIKARRRHDHSTPLRCAARRGHWVLVKVLLDHGACSNAAARWLFALRWSVCDPHTLKYLTSPSDKQLSTTRPKSLCDVSDRKSSGRTQSERPEDTTRTRRASWSSSSAPHCSSNTLKRLRFKTAGAPGDGDATALHAACLAEDIASLQALLEHTHTADALEHCLLPEGLTPLHIAAQRGWLCGVTALLDAGASPYAATDTDGATPLHLAAAQGHMDVIEHLLTHGAALRARDCTGATPLIVALQNGRSRTLKLLLQHSGGTSSSSEAQTAPLSLQALARAHSARSTPVASLTSKSTTALLLTFNVSDTTALHLAAFSGDLELVQDLVYGGGIDIDAHDSDGATPVWLAALMGHLAVVVFLAEHGADASVGASVAAEFGHLEALAFVSTWSTPALDIAASSERRSLTRLSLDDHERETRRSLTHPGR